MRERGALIGSLTAGLLASACCLGPLLLGALGAGSLGLGAAIAPWRPWLLGLTGVFLLVGFYLAYRPRRVAACTPGDACTVPEKRRSQRVTLWAVTLLTVTMATYPTWAARLGARGAPASATRATAHVVIDVEGMTCESCAREIEVGLRTVPGVVSANVDYESRRADVGLARRGGDPEALLAAVRDAGYRASLTGTASEQDRAR